VDAPVYAYLKRLLTTTAAYQAADIASKFIALGLLPVYTRHISRSGYGVAELLGTLVIFVSILVRLGIGEAFVRYWYSDEDPERRATLARRAVGSLLVATTATGVVLVALAGPLSEVVLVHRDATTFSIAVLGLWAFTNLELAYAQLRVEERARAFLVASLSNVTLTIGLTVWLVVGADQGARGLLLGNYAGSTVVLVGLWWTMRHRLLPRRPTPAEPLRRLLSFGLPTVPADASVFALNLVDRYYLFHHSSSAVAGLYSLAVKLAGVVVFTVRAFQYAWPPLAYSVRSDEEASRLYALVTTYYVLLTGWIVVGLTLLGRWVVRLFAAPRFYAAHAALPWLALGWALYGLFVVFVVIAGRAQVTKRNFPAALAGLVANVVLLLVLVPPYGIAGAGIALCGAYVVMLGAMYLFTRRLFTVAFEWRRLALLVGVLAGVAVAGELLLPTHGGTGFVTRAVALVAVPALLALARFFRPEEVARLRALASRGRWMTTAAR
jgi:O-antigen/teichoic acid export membrane protein